LTSLGWVLIHLDDRFFLTVPQRPDTEDLIRREGYHHIVPWDNAPVTPENAHQVLEEAERALRNCPDQATFAWAYKARALQQLHRNREAFEAGRNISKMLWIQ
jgi:hypothetical protein